MSRDELIAAFSLDGISGGAAVFDPEKLDWYNAQYLAQLKPDDLVRDVKPLLQAAGVWSDEYDDAGPSTSLGAGRGEWLQRVLRLVLPRVRRLPDFVLQARPFLTATIEYDPEAVRKHLNRPPIRRSVEALIVAMEADTAPLRRSRSSEYARRGDARRVKAAALIPAAASRQREVASAQEYSRCWRFSASRSRCRAFSISCGIYAARASSRNLRRLFSDGVAHGKLQRRRPAVPELEVGEEPVLVREAEREERSGVRAPRVVLAHEHHRRSAPLIHAPRAADLNVIQELNVEGRRRIIAAEPAVDAGPEPETLKQLARLEVRADEGLFRVDGDAALEADALARRGPCPKKDSKNGNGNEKAYRKEEESARLPGKSNRCQPLTQHPRVSGDAVGTDDAW